MYPAPRSAGFTSPIPRRRYFAVDLITRDQVENYAKREEDAGKRGRTLARSEPGLRPFLSDRNPSGRSKILDAGNFRRSACSTRIINEEAERVVPRRRTAPRSSATRGRHPWTAPFDSSRRARSPRRSSPSAHAQSPSNSSPPRRRVGASSSITRCRIPSITTAIRTPGSETPGTSADMPNTILPETSFRCSATPSRRRTSTGAAVRRPRRQLQALQIGVQRNNQIMNNINSYARPAFGIGYFGGYY